MRFFAVFTICAVAALGSACDRQPLAGDPHPGIEDKGHEVLPHAAATAGESAATHSPGEAAPLPHDGEAAPAEPAKTEEAPRFFPEKK